MFGSVERQVEICVWTNKLFVRSNCDEKGFVQTSKVIVWKNKLFDELRSISYLFINVDAFDIHFLVHCLFYLSEQDKTP